MPQRALPFRYQAEKNDSGLISYMLLFYVSK